MSTGLFLVQALNGLQLGILLFLVAAGLTLVFGVMDFINLAHGHCQTYGQDEQQHAVGDAVE